MNAAPAAVSSPKLCTLPPIEVFAAGYKRGDWYSLDDLKTVVRNFHRLYGANGERNGCKVNPPIVLGHDEEQTVLADHGLPAAGIIGNLWLQGSKLIAVPTEVPAVVGRWINQRAYRTVSAEFWPNLVDDHGREHGLVLRRVALLGADLPQDKTLADLPLAMFSDRPLRRAHLVAARRSVTRRHTVVCFCDVVPVVAPAPARLVDRSKFTPLLSRRGHIRLRGRHEH